MSNGSSTNRPTHVPGLHDKTREQAVAALGDIRLRTKPDEPQADWRVQFQQPPAGTKIEEPRGAFFVAAIDGATADQKLTRVPDLKGKTENEARKALLDVPLHAWRVPVADSSDGDWIVDSQQPPPGTEVPDPSPSGYFVGTVMVFEPSRTDH